MIPNERVFTQQLHNAREYEFEVHGTRRIALVEPAREGNFYGCTVSDVEHLLSLAPEADVEDLDLFLFRQPTRKQRILSPVWGRFLYYAYPGKYESSAICFEAQGFETIRWSKSLNPEGQRDLDRLRRDGHRVEIGKRSIDIHMSVESFRNTTLFRTALHEIGHYADWLHSVLNFEGTKQEWAEARRAFDTKPSAMLEDFAHRYAEELAEELRQQGELPFEVRWNDDAMAQAKIEKTWFAAFAG